LKGKNYLCRRGPQRGPVYAMQNVCEELRVELDLVLCQLGVLGVQGEGVRRRLAGLDGAGQEI